LREGDPLAPADDGFFSDFGWLIHG
jgi:hypothetical protein